MFHDSTFCLLKSLCKVLTSNKLLVGIGIFSILILKICCVFFFLSRKKINIQPGQNVLKYIQDCFECKPLFGVVLNLLVRESFLSCTVCSDK